MSDTLGYALLPSIVISSTALIVMLFAAIKREHRYTSLLTSLGLFVALSIQLSQIKNAPFQSDLFLFDGTTSLLSALLILVALLLSFLLYPWLENLKDPKEEYYMLFLLATQGALVVCASSHFASFFLGLELMGLSLVPMVAYPDRDNKALEAGIKYLVLSAVASAFVLMAIAIIYFYSGTLDIQEIAQHLPFANNETQVNDVIYGAAIILLLVGFAFKLSLAPCHLWLADLLEGSPLPTAALLATLSKAAIFVVLIRLFSYGNWHQQEAIIVIISAVAVASMLIGNFLALLQNNLLRLLAFSSVAHFGYILLAILAIQPADSIAGETTLANEAAIYYLFAYLLTSAGAFSILMILQHDTPSLPFTLERLRGLFWLKPATALVLTLLFLSLAGIPLTIGFVGKFYLTLAAVNGQLWGMLAALVIGSVVGIYYYLRVVLMMAEKPKQQTTRYHKPHSISDLIIMGLVTLMVMGIGIFPAKLATIIEQLVA